MGEEDFDAAFPGLFPPAFGVAYRILDDVTDAEDAAAEALARALVRWNKVGSLPNREAWVMRVASNVAIDRVRKRAPAPVAPAPGGDGNDNAALRAALVTALAGLSRRQREVVALRYIAGLDEAEVATCLGLSDDDVKKEMLRATNALRKRLDHDLPEVHVDAD